MLLEVPEGFCVDYGIRTEGNGPTVSSRIPCSVSTIPHNRRNYTSKVALSASCKLLKEQISTQKMLSRFKTSFLCADDSLKWGACLLGSNILDCEKPASCKQLKSHVPGGHDRSYMSNITGRMSSWAKLRRNVRRILPFGR